MAKYIIGIDFGTTNCTMASTCVDGVASPHDIPEIVSLPIQQLVSAGSCGEQGSLPSFVYFPLQEEQAAATTPWGGEAEHCVGLFARERGAEVPDRLIASAKSWLCHAGIDRRSKLLPRGSSGDEGLGLMSPLEACSRLLTHLRDAWNHTMKKKAPFDKQTILITVPASFDPSARQLVQEAAELAGYPEILLLEEPQAAFYAWLHRHHDRWRDQLAVGDTILVVDVGGGTTDFTLISVSDEGGQLALERLAVGVHLLLGGDNMDLALAYLAKEKLEQAGHQVDDWRLQCLVHSCRRAKERLFGDEAVDQVDIAIQGRGSRLVGGTIKATITREEANKLLVEGFLPLVGPEERSLPEQRAGLQQIGLPFAQDPRISCQLARFLSLTGESDSATMEHFVMPTKVLFNGGAMKGAPLRDQLVLLLNQWSSALGKGPVKVLSDPDYDNGVSRGAVYYGLARAGKGVRIRGGTSRSYYIGVEGAVPAVPGLKPPLHAFCVVPYGMEEGTEQSLPEKQFALVLGEKATFRFFSRSAPTLSTGEEAAIGSCVRSWQGELTELHPVETRLERGELDGRTVCVTLQSRVNELGVLELWCLAKDGRRWKLEFDLRKPVEKGEAAAVAS